MLTLFPLLIAVVVYAIKLKLHRNVYFYINVFVLFFVVSLSFIENILIFPGEIFVRLDESYFYSESSKGLSYILQQDLRYIGYLLFSHITLSSGPDWMLKLQSVPFSLLTLMVLFDVTRKNLTLILYPIIFGYLYFLSTLNMRDSMLIFLMLASIKLVTEAGITKAFVCAVSFLILFYFIRPEYSYIWVFLYLWYLLSKSRLPIKYTVYAPALTIVVAYVWFDEFIYLLIDYFQPGRLDVYLAERFVADGNVLLNPNLIGFIRQLFTPNPYSKVVELFDIGYTDNLFFKEVFRIIMMSGFYLLCLLLVVKFRGLIRLVRNNDFMKVLLMFSIIHTILYAIYGDGGGASRNKVYPYIFVFLAYVMISRDVSWNRKDIQQKVGL